MTDALIDWLQREIPKQVAEQLEAQAIGVMCCVCCEYFAEGTRDQIQYDAVAFRGWIHRSCSPVAVAPDTAVLIAGKLVHEAPQSGRRPHETTQTCWCAPTIVPVIDMDFVRVEYRDRP